jgi:hypothetical protein
VSSVNLQERIDRLERVARRDRLFALGALALVLATAQAPASTSTSTSTVVVNASTGEGVTLNASGLTVHDAKRIVRTSVGMDELKRPGLYLWDTAGKLREGIYLLGSDEQPMLRLFDSAGMNRAEMFVANDTHNGTFEILDAAGVPRLGAFRDNSGNPELAVYGSDKAVRATIASDDDGPYIVMKDNHAVTRLVIGQYTSGTFGVDVRGPDGKAIWSRP